MESEIYNSTNTNRILGEYRVSQAEHLENDYGPEIAFYVVTNRAREAQIKALRKEIERLQNVA